MMSSIFTIPGISAVGIVILLAIHIIYFLEALFMFIYYIKVDQSNYLQSSSFAYILVHFFIRILYNVLVFFNFDFTVLIYLRMVMMSTLILYFLFEYCSSNIRKTDKLMILLMFMFLALAPTLFFISDSLQLIGFDLIDLPFFYRHMLQEFFLLMTLFTVVQVILYRVTASQNQNNISKIALILMLVCMQLQTFYSVFSFIVFRILNLTCGTILYINLFNDLKRRLPK